MRKTIQRLISSILSFALVITMLPAAAVCVYAEEGDRLEVIVFDGNREGETDGLLEKSEAGAITFDLSGFPPDSFDEQTHAMRVGIREIWMVTAASVDEDAGTDDGKYRIYQDGGINVQGTLLYGGEMPDFENEGAGWICGISIPDAVAGTYRLKYITTEGNIYYSEDSQYASAVTRIVEHGGTSLGPSFITSETLPEAVAGSAYAIQFQADSKYGGSLSWTAQFLPEGLTLSTDGLLSGTAPDVDATSYYTIRVTVSENGGDSSDGTFFLTVRSSEKLISFYLNGGSPGDGSSRSTYKVLRRTRGSAVTMPAAPVLPGCTFLGWKHGSAYYQPGETFTVGSSDADFTADWEEKEGLTVTLNKEVCGNVSLHLKDGNSNYYVLKTEHLPEPTALSGEHALKVTAADLERVLQYITPTGLELWGELDGRSALLASWSGSVTYGTVAPLSPVPFDLVCGALTVTGGGGMLTEGKDYIFSQVLWGPAGSDSFSVSRRFPFMAGSNASYQVKLEGLPGSPSYSLYDWTAAHDAVLNASDGSLSVVLPSIEDETSVTVNGRITMSGESLANVTVMASQFFAGMTRTLAAVTDEDGCYQLKLYPGSYVSFSVRNGSRDLRINTGNSISWDNMTPNASLTNDIDVSYAVFDLELTIEATATEGQGQLLERYLKAQSAYLNYDFSIEGSRISSGSLYLNDTSLKIRDDLPAPPNAAVKIAGRSALFPSALNAETTLASGAGSVMFSTAVNAGVLVTLNSDPTSSYAFVWYDETGDYISRESATLFSGDSEKAFVCPADTKAGSFHAVLIHSAMVSSLRSFNSSTKTYEYLNYAQAKMLGGVAKTWDFTLAENEITELEGISLNETDSRNNQYLTKPGSSMTPSSENWTSSGEMVTITGMIGLDDGLSDGRLLHLYGDPTLPEDGGDTQTIRIPNITINGERYEPTVILHSDTWYLDLQNSGRPLPTLPCTYTIYAYPASEGRDMYLDLYADVSYTGVTGEKNQFASNQYVGEVRIPAGASIYTTSMYVNRSIIAVNGKAEPERKVEIYDNGLKVGEAVTDRAGSWTAQIELAGTDAARATVHYLKVVSETGASSDDALVVHQAGGVQLTSFTMSWKNSASSWAGVRTIPVGGKCQFTGALYDVSFKAVIENPEMLLDNYTGFDDEKVVFKVVTADGYVRYLYPEQEGNVFTASIDTTLRSPVTLAEVIFGGKIVTGIEGAVSSESSSPTVYNISDSDVSLLTEILDDMLVELTDSFDPDDPTRITSVQQVLDVVGLYTAEHSFSVSYDAEGNPAFNGTDYTDPEDADMQAANMKKLAEVMAEDDVLLKEYAISYDSEENLIQWINRTGEEYYDGDPERMGIFTTTRVYASEEDFLTEKEVVAQYAEAHKQESWGSVQTVDGYYLGDLYMDSALKPSSGTFAIGVQFADILTGGTHLYSAKALLVLTDDFHGYSNQNLTGVDLKRNLLGSRSGPSVSLLGNTSPYGPSNFNGNYHSSGLFNFTSSAESGSNKMSWLAGGAGNTGDGISELWKGTKGAYARNMEKVAGGVGKFFGKVSNYLGGAAIGFSTFNLLWRAHRDDLMMQDMDAITDSPCFKKLPKSDQLKGLRMRKELQDMIDIRNWIDFDSLIVGPLTMSAGWLANAFVDGSAAAFSAALEENAIASLIASGAMPNTAATGGLGGVGATTATGASASAAFGWTMLAVTVGATVAAGHLLEEKEAETISTYNANYNYIKGMIHKHASMPATWDPDCQDPEKRDQKNSPSPVKNDNEFDPSGIVYEAVIENPVEGATVRLYYATDDTGAIYKKTESALADQLKPAEGLTGMDPQDSVQITDENGRFQWFVPEGLWYVTAEYGHLAGDSNLDKEAVVSRSLPSLDVHTVSSLLPVLPVQLNVNIPLVDAAAPEVTDITFIKGEGIRVSFSKYMVDTGSGPDSVLNAANYTLHDYATDTQIVISEVKALRQGSTPNNLKGQDAATYSRQVLLVPENVATMDSSRALDLTVSGTLTSYAGTPIGEDSQICGFVLPQLSASGLALSFKGISNSDDQSCAFTATLLNESGKEVTATVLAAVYYDGRLLTSSLISGTYSDESTTDLPFDINWTFEAADTSKITIELICYDSVTGVPLCDPARVKSGE